MGWDDGVHEVPGSSGTEDDPVAKQDAGKDEQPVWIGGDDSKPGDSEREVQRAGEPDRPIWIDTAQIPKKVLK